MAFSSLRSLLYKLGRLLGDINAVSKGPTAILKRIERRALGRLTGRGIRRIVDGK